MIATAAEAVQQDPARPARLHRHRLRRAAGARRAPWSAAAAELPDTEIVHLLTFGDAPYAHRELAAVLPRQQLLHRRERPRHHPGRAGRLHADLPLRHPAPVQLRPAAARRGPDPGHARRTSTACAASASRWTSSRAPPRTPRSSSPRSTRNMPRTLGDCFIHVHDIDVLVPVDAPLLEVPPPEADRDDPRRSASTSPRSSRTAPPSSSASARIPQAVLRVPQGQEGPRHPHRDVHRRHHRPDRVGRHHRQRARRSTAARSWPASAWARSGSTTTSTTTRCSRSTPPSTSTTRSSSPAAQDGGHQRRRWRSTSPARSAPTRSATAFYSGIGGQVDFNRGAARSPGGKAIIALPSTAKDGTISRIVTRLSPGAGVVTTRGDVHYVVTEYGVAYLHGKSMQERALALIRIAHPKFRAAAAAGGHRGQVPAPGAGRRRGQDPRRAARSCAPPICSTTARRSTSARSIRPTSRACATCSTRCRRRRSTTASCAHRSAFPRSRSRTSSIIDHRNDVTIVGTRARGARRGHHRHRPLLPRPEDQPARRWPSSCATTGRTAASARSC